MFKKTNNPTTLPAVQTDRQTLTTRTRIAVLAFFVSHFHFRQGIARTQSPSPRNYALESSTFEMIGEVNPPEVQWTGLAPGVPPNGSGFLPCQVSMLAQRVCISPRQKHFPHLPGVFGLKSKIQYSRFLFSHIQTKHFLRHHVRTDESLFLHAMRYTAGKSTHEPTHTAQPPVGPTWYRVGLGWPV